MCSGGTVGLNGSRVAVMPGSAPNSLEQAAGKREGIGGLPQDLKGPEMAAVILNSHAGTWALGGRKPISLASNHEP